MTDTTVTYRLTIQGNCYLPVSVTMFGVGGELGVVENALTRDGHWSYACQICSRDWMTLDEALQAIAINKGYASGKLRRLPTP